MQAGQASSDEAFSPESDGVSIAVEFGGDVLVGGSVVLSDAEDESAAESQRLGRGAGLDQCLELFAVLFGEDDG